MHHNNLIRVRDTIKAGNTLDFEELYKLGGFDGPIPNLDYRDGTQGGMYESELRAILDQILAEDYEIYTIPPVV